MIENQVENLLKTFLANDLEKKNTFHTQDEIKNDRVEKNSTYIDILTFALASEDYAIGIEHIYEIITLPQITRVFRTKSFVLGIISLRGWIVPVIDGRRLMGLHEKGASRFCRVIVLRPIDNPIGILVDRVEQVSHLDPTSIEVRPMHLRSEVNRFVLGISHHENRLLILLDAAILLEDLASLA